MTDTTFNFKKMCLTNGLKMIGIYENFKKPIDFSRLNVKRAVMEAYVGFAWSYGYE